jgi:hypothetical protein
VVFADPVPGQPLLARQAEHHAGRSSQ